MPQTIVIREPVVWTNFQNTTATGNTLTKTSGTTGFYNASAQSVQNFFMTDCSVEVTIDITAEKFLFGFNNSNTDLSYGDINYCWFVSGVGTANVYLEGVSQPSSSTSAPIGTILSIQIAGGIVSFLKNGIVIFTTPTTHATPLFVDCTINGLGDSISNTYVQYTKVVATIHEAMAAPSRQVFGKVEVVYSDPFLDRDSVSATSNQTARETTASAVIEGTFGSPYKWFSLQDNKLDGSYHPIPLATDKYPAGVWGTTMSDPLGALSTSLVITVNFSLRGIYHVDVWGDDKLNEYPVDFTVDVYGVSNTIIHTYTVTGNTSIPHVHQIPEGIASAIKIVVTITKVNKSNRTAKITEIYSGITETYEGTDIVSIDLLEEQQFDDGSLPIGNISSNEIDISLINLDGKFDPSNQASPLFGLLLKNRPVRAWLGADLGDGNISWYQLGKFWTQGDWKAPRDSMYVSFASRDRLELLKETEFTTSLVYTNTNLKDMALMVLEDYGLAPTEYIVDDSLADITIPYFWLDRMSHRDALKQIAIAALGRVYCDRQGRIIVTTFKIPTEVTVDFTEDNYYGIDPPLAWSQIVNYAEVTYASRVVQTQSVVYTSTEVITVPANGSVVETILFTDAPVTNVQTPIITKAAAITVISELYAWGGILTFTNPTGAPLTVTAVTIDGQIVAVTSEKIVVAQDTTSIKFNGKQKYTAASPYFQDAATAQIVANSILATYKDPRHDVTIDARGDIGLELGNKITAPDYGNATIKEYVVTRQDIKYDGALRATVQGQFVGE